MDSIFAQETQFDAGLLELSATIDVFEGYAHAHGARVATIVDVLAQRFNFALHDRFALSQAALVHDIGEQLMNRDYIQSSSGLTTAQRIDLERHPVIGEQAAAKKGFSRAVQLLVRWHHEWWNGAGYPDAISREQIPLAARILRLSDTYAALTADRAHRKAVSAAEAAQYLTESAAIEFDPKVVKEFLSMDEAEEG